MFLTRSISNWIKRHWNMQLYSMIGSWRENEENLKRGTGDTENTEKSKKGHYLII